MAYNFLDLTNEACRRLNEVELTQDNFGNVKGFQSHIKDAVNSAIRDINYTHYEWPFNHSLVEEILTPGITRYPFPVDAAFVNPETFRIKEDETFGNETMKLKLIDYDDYLNRYIDQEYRSDDSTRECPQMVFLTTGLEYGVVPVPDQEYEIVYEYFRVPADLELYTDVPSIPERYRSVIIDGAMYHAYLFRSNEQAAAMAKEKFDKGITRMRTMLIGSSVQYMRSGMVSRSAYNNAGPRVTNGG
jgi:hypothetical protein